MFVNETKNDAENNLKVSMKLTSKVRLVLLLAGIFLALVGVVLLVLELTVFKLEDEPADISSFVTFIISGAVIASLSFALPSMIKKNIVKSMMGKEAEVRYVFENEGYEISAKSSDMITSSTNGNYEALAECREYADFWLLYYNKAAFYILSKNGMKEGTAEDLTAFLKEKLGTRYKVKFRRK